jgi:hypothetical protein
MAEYEILKEEVLKVAEKDFSKFSSSNKEGFARSIENTIILLELGYSKSEISEWAGVSKTFIDKQVKQFANHPTIKRIHKELIEARQ